MRYLPSILVALMLSLLGGAEALAQPRPWRPDVQRLAPYDQGYERGYQEGVRDARRGRPPALDQRGPQRGRRGEAGRGYADGYRAGFTSERAAHLAPSPRGPLAPRAVQPDPAYARGQSDGYRRGFDDGNDRDRYDPTREGAYRDGDAGYFRDYGPRDAYRRNYRDGFRQGYEGGYRDGARSARR
ncbi:MAG: hypothetical protein ABL971_12270 [Vicinamibacterales bacterium]